MMFLPCFIFFILIHVGSLVYLYRLHQQTKEDAPRVLPIWRLAWPALMLICVLSMAVTFMDNTSFIFGMGGCQIYRYMWMVPLSAFISIGTVFYTLWHRQMYRSA